MTASLLLGLTACSRGETRLFVGGSMSSYTEYYYENVKVEKGRESVFDFRDEDRELDWRSTIVY